MTRVTIGSAEYTVPESTARELEHQITQNSLCRRKEQSFDAETEGMLKRAVDSLYESEKGIELLSQLETMRFEAKISFDEGHSVVFHIIPSRRAGPSFDIEGVTYDIDEEKLPPFMFRQMVRYYQEVDINELLHECYFCEDRDFDVAYEYARSQCRKLYLGIRVELYNSMIDELGISKGVRYDQSFITMLLDSAYDMLRKDRMAN